MLKYAYELGAAAAYHDFAKEAAWPSWLTGLLGAGVSKVLPNEGTRREFLIRPATKALASAAVALPKAVANSAVIGGLASVASRVGTEALEHAPDMSRRGFLGALGTAGAAGAVATAGRTARKVEQSTGNIFDDVHTLGGVINGDLMGSSRLAKRLRMLSEAKRLDSIDKLTSKDLKDTARLVGDAAIDAGPVAVMNLLLGESSRFGITVRNPLPGIL